MESKFSKEEIKAAIAVREQIVNSDESELKGVYMAGEICMWHELNSQPETVPVRAEEVDFDLANKIYQELNNRGAGLGNASILYIKSVLESYRQNAGYKAKEEDAVSFANFIQEEKYVYNGRLRKYVAAWDNYAEYTITELYQEYITQKQLQK